MPSTHLAIDLGAGSGRALLGLLSGDPKTLRVEEVHRFEHTPVETPAGPVWDLTGIANQVMIGLRAGVEAARAVGAELRSVGVDSWGVDWGVVAPSGELVGLPHCYRDPANAAAQQRVLAKIEGGAGGLYARNGIQPHPFNTLFQLGGRLETAPEAVPPSGRLLLLPDLLHFWLSGVRCSERTNASTGAMLTLDGEAWDRPLLDRLGVPQGLLGEIRDAGARLGPLREKIAATLGLKGPVEVVAPATHDTASAVAAVPAVGQTPGAWAYLSSGTWSLLGVELAEPIATPEALAAGFTNELGVRQNGRPTVRFLRNISGLWLVQELQRDLARLGNRLDFAELARLAADSAPFRTIIDPDAADLAAPGDSVEKLRGHAARTGQPVPQTPGELTRCCLESLALSYAETLDRLETLVGHKIDALHAVGGGIKNTLLNKLTADAIGRPVITGPIEASGVGNLLVQAIGLGLVTGLDELREIVARSFPVERLEPDTTGPGDGWAEARRRYTEITTKPTPEDGEDE